jgi:hypothetical protein
MSSYYSRCKYTETVSYRDRHGASVAFSTYVAGKDVFASFFLPDDGVIGNMKMTLAQAAALIAACEENVFAGVDASFEAYAHYDDGEDD